MVKLGDVCDVERGGSPRPIDKFITEDDNGVNWIKIGDTCDDNMYITKTKQKIIPEGMKKSRYVQPGDFLLTNSMSFGRPYILKIDGCIHDGWLVLRNKNNHFHNEFLYYALSSKGTYKKFKSLAVGGVVNNLNSTIVKQVEFPLPPLETQKQIAKTLDTASELLAMHKQQLAELDNLIKSTFYDMFGDPVTNDKGWKISGFIDVATIDTKMTKDFDRYAEYPHIGIDSIEKSTGNIVDYKLVKDSNIISGKYLFSDKHIIYSKIRPNLNKVALPTFCGLCSADAYPILPKENISDKSYLAYILRSGFFLNYILDFSGRTNIPKVNKQQLGGFQLPIPPIKLQSQFSEIVTKIEEQKALVKKAIDETQVLFDSLMSEYFA